MTQDKPDIHLPSHVAMAWPTLCAIRRAGGSATIADILEQVAAELSLDAHQRSLLLGKGSRTLLSYRLAWTRTFLKNMGAISNDGRGRWVITETGHSITTSDIKAASKQQLARLRESENSRVTRSAKKSQKLSSPPERRLRTLRLRALFRSNDPFIRGADELPLPL